GHEDPSKPQSAIRWDHLARGADTLVFFMGVSRIREIAGELIRHGRSASTPVAVIRWGTYTNQETWVSDLAGVASVVEREKIKSPALIVVGEVVQMRERLQWFKELRIADCGLRNPWSESVRLASNSFPNPFFEALAS